MVILKSVACVEAAARAMKVSGSAVDRALVNSAYLSAGRATRTTTAAMAPTRPPNFAVSIY